MDLQLTAVTIFFQRQGGRVTRYSRKQGEIHERWSTPLVITRVGVHEAFCRGERFRGIQTLPSITRTGKGPTEYSSREESRTAVGRQ